MRERENETNKNSPLFSFFLDPGDPSSLFPPLQKNKNTTGLKLHLNSLRNKDPAQLASSSGDYAIEGNVLIDPSAKIGAGAKVGPNVCIGKDCVLGAGEFVFSLFGSFLPPLYLSLLFPLFRGRERGFARRNKEEEEENSLIFSFFKKKLDKLRRPRPRLRPPPARPPRRALVRLRLHRRVGLLGGQVGPGREQGRDRRGLPRQGRGRAQRHGRAAAQGAQGVADGSRGDRDVDR